MTERLYYTDPYLREFDATVTRVEPRGPASAVVELDRTAFYPTSGGQPFDVGTLGGFPVVEVLDQEDGSIAHVVDVSPRKGMGSSPTLGAGATLHGAIDWPRRFDHMQQHTGQHVLSGAFDRLLGARTVSFHLGAASSTIDLAREVTAVEIATAEAEANRIVWEDRPVTIRFADSADAAQMTLRKEPKRTGRLRLIEVEDFDLSACGGTHVARTGGIGVIAVGSWERFKGGQRIEFLCGGRALARFHELRDASAGAMKRLSIGAAELPSAIERLQADAKEQKRAIAALQNDLAKYRADELAAAAETTGKGQLVVRALDADANGLKSLAMAIAARPGHIAALVSTSSPALIVVARAADVQVQANAVLAGMTATFGGRGGGKPDLAQGGGLAAPSAALLEALRRAVLE